MYPITPSAQELCGGHEANAFRFLQGAVSSFLNSDFVGPRFSTIGDALPGIIANLFGASFSNGYAFLFAAALAFAAFALFLSMAASAAYGLGRALGGGDAFDMVYKIGFYIFFAVLNILAVVSFLIIAGAACGTVLSEIRLLQQVVFQTPEKNCLLAGSIAEGRLYLIIAAVLAIAQYCVVSDRRGKIKANDAACGLIGQKTDTSPPSLWRIAPYALYVPAVSLLAIIAIELILLAVMLFLYVTLIAVTLCIIGFAVVAAAIRALGGGD